MPADKLILRVMSVKPHYSRLASRMGKPVSGYESSLDLRRTKSKFPVRIYCDGRFGTHNNKVEFIDVSRLGLGRVTEIAEAICGSIEDALIYRIDWSVDILGVSVEDLASCCEVSGVQNSMIRRSALGISSYPHLSNTRTELIYDKLAHLRATKDPRAQLFGPGDQLTRFEVQFRGQGVPIREFRNIREYGDIDLISGVRFRQLRTLASGLRPMQALAARGMRCLVQEYGLQIASKTFGPGVWAYYRKKFFRSLSESQAPDIRALMQQDARDWLDDKIRFPRSKYRNQ